MTEDYDSLKHQAEEFRRKGKCDEAIPLYEQLWNMSTESRDKWIGWGYAHCLRKVGQPKDALEICREVYKIDDQFDHNNNLYGWCIYDIGIKQADENFDEERLVKAAEAITALTTQGDYSPYEWAVFAVVRHYEKYKDGKRSVPHAKIITWLDKLDPDRLSTKPGQGSNGKSYPSPKEEWYTNLSKALYGLERHEECVAVCTQALAEFQRLHYDYDVWFRHTRAESLLALDRGEEALADIEYMMERKPDAWIRHLYARALRSVGRIDEAISYAAEAAIPPKRLGFRWEVYLDLGNMLADTGQKELAAKHILLAAAIRQEEGWEKIPQSLQAALHRMNVTLEGLPQAKSLHQELQPFWKSVRPQPKTTHAGIIDYIHSNGKSGVILADSGTSYFFGMRSYNGETEAMPGLRVSFNIRQVVNKKTNKPEMHAVDIRPEV